MIVKQRNFKLTSGTLYGVAGGAFGVITLGLMVQSHVAPETYASCSQRYPQAGMFGLQRSSGTLLAPAELQSRLAGQDWGVMQNLQVKADPSATRKVSMAVGFNAGGEADRATNNVPSGMGFRWQPGYLKKASAACLSYSVRLPKNFKFAKGGTLPGLFGAEANSGLGEKEEFSLRMRWLAGGKVGIQPVTPKQRDGHLMILSDKWLEFPRDRWISIEQEVVLNTPGKTDGLLRIWVDGQLQMTMPGLVFRKDAKTKFAGVIADTHYADGKMDWMPAPKSAEVRLSPMILRWN